MQRREFFQGLLAAPVVSAAAADDYTSRLKGLPPLTIKDVKVITTSGGRNYRWVFLKIMTSEAGLYGIIRVPISCRTTFRTLKTLGVGQL